MNHQQPSQQSPLRQNGSKRVAPCDRRGKPAAPHCAQQQPRIEIPLTLACIAVTLAGWLGATWETGSLLVQQYAGNETRGWMEEAIFIVVTQVLIYGSLVYQFTRYGFLRRSSAHRPLSPSVRAAIYGGSAGPLVVLVPSYREEPAIVRRSLMSAALQDYPHRRVVLLIDDPPWPATSKERAALRAMRR